MNEAELEKRLTDLAVKFTASTFKPNAQEIAVYEQLINHIDELALKISNIVQDLDIAEKKLSEGPQAAGVTLKKVHPDFLQPLKQI